MRPVRAHAQIGHGQHHIAQRRDMIDFLADKQTWLGVDEAGVGPKPSGQFIQCRLQFLWREQILALHVQRQDNKFVRKNARDHTDLVIDHHLSTDVDADIILVLQHGHIVERGSHQALLETNGNYAELWRAQLWQRDPLTA